MSGACHLGDGMGKVKSRFLGHFGSDHYQGCVDALFRFNPGFFPQYIFGDFHFMTDHVDKCFKKFVGSASLALRNRFPHFRQVDGPQQPGLDFFTLGKRYDRFGNVHNASPCKEYKTDIFCA